MCEVRWTDKVYLDSQGNILDFNGDSVLSLKVRYNYDNPREVTDAKLRSEDKSNV